MAHARKPTATVKRSAASRLVMLFALLMFGFQGYLVQTHVHASAPVAQTGIHLSTPATPDPADPYNPASCPLCQEILHAGVFVMPSLATLPLQLDWIVFLTSSVLPEPVTTERSLNWQSRAPPRR